MKLKAIIITALFATLSLASMDAKDKKKDKEDVHVDVILFSGDTINGYLRSDLKTGLKNMFSKSGPVRQYINIGEEPNGGETRRLSASEVKEYHFLEPTEGYPEGARVVSERISAPSPFKPKASIRGFVFVIDSRESGSILKWNVWESTGGRNSRNYLVPAIGVKLKGARAAYILTSNGLISMYGLMSYLKKQYPELHDYLKEYYNKGKDAKAHRKELIDNPSTFLVVYEKFLQDHDPLADPEEETEPIK